MSWWLFLWVPLWIIAGIVALALLLLLIIVVLLAIPIKYNAVAVTKGGKYSIRVRAKYLFATYTYIRKTGETKTQLKVAGRVLRNSQDKSKTEQKTEKSISKESKTSDESTTSKKSTTTKPKGFHTSSTVQKPKDNFFTRTKERFITTRDKIYSIIYNPDRKRFTRWTITAIKKTIRSLKPKRISIEGTVGFADPALTGLLIGGTDAFATVANLRDHIQIAPKFDIDQTEINLKAKIEGKLSLLKFVMPTISWATKCGTVLLFRKIQNKISGGKK